MEKITSIIAKIIAPLTIVAGALLLGLHLQAEQAYMFFYCEAQQLLFLEWGYIWDLMTQFGGVGITIAQSLVQFFIHPGVGATVTALLAGTSAALLWLALRKMCNCKALLPLLFAPALMWALYLATAYYHYDGLVALTAMALVLWVYTLFVEAGYKLRLAMDALLSVTLYLLFGPVGLLFAVCALLFDLAKRSEKWYLDLIYVALLLVAGSYLVSNGKVADFETAYGTKFYYEFYVELTPFLNAWWWIVVAIVAAFLALSFVKNIPAWGSALTYVVLALAVAGLYIQRHDVEKKEKENIYTYMQLYHNIVNEQWEEITSNRNVNYQIPLHSNCVNFALSKQGLLLDKLFLYPQNGLASLFNENMGTFVEEHSIYSEIYYHLGIVSQTLELSLAAMAGSYPGTPLLLQQFVRSRVVMGDYDLAGKFVYRLSKTYGYRDWALRQQGFLHNDAAVEADAEYGLKRRTLPELSSEFVSLNGFVYDLMKVLTANPENNVARDYAIAALLLNKNFDDIRYFVEEYYGTPILPTLHERLQEAVVTYAEKDMDYCRRYGVSEQTISRFAQFRQKVLTLRHQRQTANPKSQLPEFRDTFWFYML